MIPQAIVPENLEADFKAEVPELCVVPGTVEKEPPWCEALPTAALD
jgi:hypothetical protein